MSDLRERLEPLGLSHYHDALIAEGFDTWETVLDITESDLNSLGVKLGHRRKLQRAIAETRVQYPDRALPLFQGKSAAADNSYRSDDSNDTKYTKKGDGAAAAGATSTKRKYRRHPKPDEHAPERPASAYVIFSNQMREELKGQELSFTEIAKVVGERWQVLSLEAREAYEREASAAKEKYYAELAEYKKTPQYSEYQEYLKEFKAKHALVPGEGKRSKLDGETNNPSHGSNATSSNFQSGADASERRRRASQGHPDGLRRQRSGSSPPQQAYSRPGLQQLTSNKATSPGMHPLSAVSSPKMPDHYSPVSSSSRPTSLHKEYSGDSTYTSNSAPMLQSYPSTSSTPPSAGPAFRDLPRRSFRDSPSLPPLVHEDTTLSTDTSYSGTTPSSFPPLADAAKNPRLLPQPVPSVGATPGPFDQRPLPPLSQAPDLRPGASSIAALLRADELTRDAEGQHNRDREMQG